MIQSMTPVTRVAVNADSRVLPNDVTALGETLAVGFVGHAAPRVLVDVVDVSDPTVALDPSAVLISGHDDIAQ